MIKWNPLKYYSCITTNQHLLIKAWNLFAFWGGADESMATRMLPLDIIIDKSPPISAKKKKKKGRLPAKNVLLCVAMLFSVDLVMILLLMTINW